MARWTDIFGVAIFEMIQDQLAEQEQKATAEVLSISSSDLQTPAKGEKPTK